MLEFQKCRWFQRADSQSHLRFASSILIVDDNRHTFWSYKEEKKGVNSLLSPGLKTHKNWALPTGRSAKILEFQVDICFEKILYLTWELDGTLKETATL